MEGSHIDKAKHLVMYIQASYVIYIASWTKTYITLCEQKKLEGFGWLVGHGHDESLFEHLVGFHCLGYILFLAATTKSSMT